MISREIKSLTGLRGLAAFWVMLYHYTAVLSFFDSYRIIKPLTILLSNGYLAVDLFFILSSFVLSIVYKNEFKNGVSKKSYFSFLKKRFARIYPLFFVCLTIAILLYGNTNSLSIISNLLLISSSVKEGLMVRYSVVWSLCTEWSLYLAFPFLFYLYSRNPKEVLYVFFFTISFIHAYIYLDGPNYFFGSKIIDKLPENIKISYFNCIEGSNAYLRTFSGYLIGLIIYHNRKMQIRKAIINVVYCATLISLFIHGYDFVKCCLWGLSIMFLCRQNYMSKLLSRPVFYRLGLISYSIYLLHYFLMTGIHWGLMTYNAKVGLVILFLSVIVTIILSKFSYQYIEVVCKNWILKRKKTSPA